MIKTCQETISISRNYRKHTVWTTAVLQLSWNSPLECTHCEGKHFAAQPTRCLVSETESMIISKCYGPLSFSFSYGGVQVKNSLRRRSTNTLLKPSSPSEGWILLLSIKEGIRYPLPLPVHFSLQPLRIFSIELTLLSTEHGALLNL